MKTNLRFFWSGIFKRRFAATCEFKNVKIPLKAEDLTYRLQVLITKSKKHANRCRRKILLSEDVDQCLEEFGESPLLAAKEPETGVIAYESNPLYYHIPQAINLENLSLEDGPAMIFSPLKLEKFPILVDGKPTKFVKEKFTSFFEI
jgi:phosphoribosyl-ATP pyrophosphohydrolase